MESRAKFTILNKGFGQESQKQVNSHMSKVNDNNDISCFWIAASCLKTTVIFASSEPSRSRIVSVAVQQGFMMQCNNQTISMA
jgi:hypothetical protein